MSNRILDYPEATEITSNDYILLDNEGTGAKCIKASALNINMDNYTIKEARGAIASFDDGEDLPLAFMGAYITAIQEGSGDPSPTNIRPISGWSSVNVYNDPVYGGVIDWNQLIDGSFEDNKKWGVNNGVLSTANNIGTITVNSGTISVNMYLKSTYRPDCMSGHKYLVSFNTKVNDTKSKSFTWAVDDATYNSIILTANQRTNICKIIAPSASKFVPYIYPWGTGAATSFEGTEKCEIDSFMIIDITQVFGSTKADEIYAMEQAEVGSGVAYVKSLFPNDYYAYNTGTKTCVSAVNGNPYEFYTIDLNGTRYGGKVDLVSGVLTVDRAFVDLGTLDWQYSSIAEKFYASATALGVKAIDVSTPFNAISSALIAKSYNEIDAKTVDYAIGINPNATQLFARYSSITSASDFITAMNGVQLVYELAVPLIYSLTKQQIKSLVGENNFFANTGDSVVDYRKLWLTPEM